jgi:hypothetical protein
MPAFGSTGLFLLVVLIAAACALFLESQKLVPSDDAYITFRHVRNLLEHGRPAWNLGGEPVLGSTTPAFLFALTLFCKMLGLTHVDQAALHLNAVFHFLVVILFYLLARDLTRKTLPSILIALLVGLNAVHLYISSQGFECTMLIAALAAGLYFTRIGKDGFALILASVAPLIRPEGILLTPLVWGYILVKKRFNWKLPLAYLCIPLMWIAFSTAYYGSPVPNAISAKKKFGSIYRPYNREDIDLVRRLPQAFPYAAAVWNDPASSLLLLGSSSAESPTTVQTSRKWIMLLGLPLAVAGAVLLHDGRLIYLLFPPLFLLLYGWIGHTQPWYFPSFVVFSTVLLYDGWLRVLNHLLERFERRRGNWVSRWRVTPILSVALFLVFITVNSFTVNRGAYDHSHRGVIFPRNPWGILWDMWEVQRAHYYREAAERLETLAPESAVVMTSEVGMLGYLYPGDVIDTVGLCSPEALAFYPPPEWDIRNSAGKYYTKANNFIPTDMVMTLKPDIVINSRFYMFNLLRPGSPFLEEYEEVAGFGRIWGEPVLIFRRHRQPESADPSLRDSQPLKEVDADSMNEGGVGLERGHTSDAIEAIPEKSY